MIRKGKKSMFREVKHKIGVWVMCLTMSLKSQFQYRSSFVLKCFVMFITYFCEYISTLFLISKVSDINKWSKYEIMLIYGMATVAYAMSRLMLCGINNIPRQLKNGKFLMKLIRPESDLFCAMIEEIPVDRLGQVLLGLLIIIYSCVRNFSSTSIFWLVVFLATGTVIYSAIFIITASVSFWIINSRELLGIFTHGTLRAIVYPITIYCRILQEIFTYLVPVAFISYYPAIVILNKEGDHTVIKLVIFLVVALMWGIAKLAWTMGIKKYEGAGG